MATKKLYLTNYTAGASPTPAGTWDLTTGFTRKALGRLPGSSPNGNFSAYVTAPAATANYNVLDAQFVSDPLLAGTLSGTLELINARYATLASVFFPHYHIWVSVGNTSAVRGVLVNDLVTATASPASVRGFSTGVVTFTDLVVSAGDRIIVEVGYKTSGSYAGAASNGVEIEYGQGSGPDSTGSLTGTNTTTNFSTPIAGSPTLTLSDVNDVVDTWAPPLRFFLQNASPGYTPTVVQGSFTDTASYVTKAMDVTQSGTATTVAAPLAALTSNASVLCAKFVSPPALNGGSVLGRRMRGDVFLKCSTSLQMYPYFHMYVTVGDSDTVRGTLVSNTVIGDTFIGTSVSLQRLQGPTYSSEFGSFSIVAGDRVVIEIGEKSNTVNNPALTATLEYGGTGNILTAPTGATGQAPWVDLFGFAEFFTAPSTNAPAEATAVGVTAYDATVSTSGSGTNAPAEATAVGADAYDAVVANGNLTQDAAVSAVAYDATVSSVSSASPSAADTAVGVAAYDAVVANGNLTQDAAVTVTALDASVANGNLTQDAATTVAAYDASVANGNLTQDAAVAVSALDATVSTSATINAPAADSAVTVTALDAAVANGNLTQDAAVAATGYDASVSTTSNVSANGEATAVGVTAYDATVTVSGSTSAPAEYAPVTAVANSASIDAATLAQDAAVTATAYLASVAFAVGAPALDAAVTAAAYDATTSLASNSFSEQASVTAAAYDASVSTVTQVNAPAQQAAVIASALDASVRITVTAGTALVLVAAQQPPPPGVTSSPNAVLVTTSRAHSITTTSDSRHRTITTQ